MLLLYVKRQKCALNLSKMEMDALLMCLVAERRVVVLTKKLEDLDVVSKMLQSQNADIPSACAKLGTLFKDYASQSNRLDVDSQV